MNLTLRQEAIIHFLKKFDLERDAILVITLMPNAIKERTRYGGFHICIATCTDFQAGGIFEASSANSRGFTIRGARGDTNELKN